jgi:hypothetical protein
LSKQEFYFSNKSNKRTNNFDVTLDDCGVGVALIDKDEPPVVSNFDDERLLVIDKRLAFSDGIGLG